MVAALTTHVAPKPLAIAERTVPQTGQKEGESVICGMQQVCRTVRLVRRYQRRTLRDRVFFGMRDEGVQKRLLTKADLSFAKAERETAEIAERETRDAQNGSTSSGSKQ